MRRASRTLDRAQGGLGIGLSLVKTVVELHGGRVSASSEGPGCGSEFSIRLPCLWQELNGYHAGAEDRGGARLRTAPDPRGG